MESIQVAGIAVGEAVYVTGLRCAIILMAIFICFQIHPMGPVHASILDDEMAALSLGKRKIVYALACYRLYGAGVGGTLLGNINGLNYAVSSLGLLVLPVVVFGGLNSVPGAIVGGITIGVLQNLAGGYGDQFFPGGIKEIAPFIFMVIFLLFKPFGLWGWERIERV
jgi:branched-chain amino acid transport system permease protein